MPRHATYVVLPIRWQTLPSEIECELLYGGKNRHQRGADLRRRIYLPVEMLATDMEAESSLAGLFPRTNDN
jgi:hypothetical protein